MVELCSRDVAFAAATVRNCLQATKIDKALPLEEAFGGVRFVEAQIRAT